MLKQLIRHIFLGPHGLQTVGVPIRDGDRVVAVLFAKLKHLFFSDGDGLKIALDWKGASGLKPCFQHYNVLSKESDLLEEGDAEYVDICCCDPTKLRSWASDEVAVSIDLLSAAKTGSNSVRCTGIV